jgi:hypothetical protein
MAVSTAARAMAQIAHVALIAEGPVEVEAIMCAIPLDFKPLFFFLIWYSGGGVQLGPLGTAATNRPIVPAPGHMMMDKLVE